MHGQGCDLGQRRQDEGALVHPRMRNCQAIFANDFMAVKEQIEVQRARPKSLTPNPSQLTLDVQENIQKVAWRKIRFELSGSIKIFPLAGRAAEGFRFM